MKKEVSPLTAEEKEFASVNHKLVYGFLNYYKYNDDDFYDIAVIGYLKAVQAYFRVEKAKKYQFSTIAYLHMKSEINMYFRYQGRQKNTAYLTSIDMNLDGNEDTTLQNFIACGESDFVDAENKIYINNLLSNLTKKQVSILQLTAKGYKNLEICKMLSMCESTVRKHRTSAIADIRKALTPIPVGASA